MFKSNSLAEPAWLIKQRFYAAFTHAYADEDQTLALNNEQFAIANLRFSNQSTRTTASEAHLLAVNASPVSNYLQFFTQGSYINPPQVLLSKLRY